jgi:hypothetical protein
MHAFDQSACRTTRQSAVQRKYTIAKQRKLQPNAGWGVAASMLISLLASTTSNTESSGD